MNDIPLIFALIGLTVGCIMGLTGAGGALVSIPLFLNFTPIDLKLATVYSLMTIIASTFLSYFWQRKLTLYHYSIIISLTSIIGSWSTIPLKASMPSSVVISLLTIISLFSVYSVWKPFTSKQRSERAAKHNIILAISGILLGALTTLTGLGGGILIMPMLLGVFGLSEKEALPTGLLAIFFSSLISFLLQLKSVPVLPSNQMIGALILGVLGSILVMKELVKRFSVQTISLARKIVFTLMVISSLTSIHLKG